MQSSHSTGQKATDERTDSTDGAHSLSVVTGNPQHGDLRYIGTDAVGSDHYHSELTESVRVVEDGEVVWFEAYAPRDAWIKHVRDERGWGSLGTDDPDASEQHDSERTVPAEAIDR